MLELPITSDPAQEFNITLGALQALVEVLYNSEADLFTLSITDTISGLPVITGSSLVLGTDLLAGLGLNLGALICVDYLSLGTEPTLANVTTQVAVVWFSPEEVSSV